jgi:hypothetical protein
LGISLNNTAHAFSLPRRSCYHFFMTTVEILYRFTTPPTEAVALALAGTRDVYGIRRVSTDPDGRTLRVEFDATRLNPATVTKLVRLTGLEIAEELPLIAPPPEPAPAA